MKKIINTIVFLMIVFSCSYTQIINEFAGKVKIGQVDTVNTENSIVVRLPDGTLGERLAQTLTIHQLISISNDTIFLQNGGYIKLPATFDGAFNNLTGIPSGLADGDDDTQLTEAQVDAFTNNNGYLINELDGNPRNEIQVLSISNDTIFLEYGGFVKLPKSFNGSFNNLTGIPAGLADGDDDTQLTEAQVDAFANNNGYLLNEVDGSITNEIQDLSLSGNILTITNNGTATDIDLSAFLDNTDTQLTESQVDAFVGNNGYLSAEIDGSITNEIQALSISNDTIFLENGGYAKLPLLNDDDPTNEIQNFGVSQIGDTLYLSGGNSFIVPGISEANPQDGDGNFYPVITIGSQKWLGEDLRTTKYNDGTPIPNLPDTYSWVRDTTGAYSWYNNDPSQSPYPRGAFYNWFATDENSNGNKNVCPVGWHVPSMTEFQDLANFLGGSSVAGGKLKEIGTQFWRPPNTGATDDFGFGAIPHGRRDGFNGSFSFSIFLNTTSFYWTTYEENSRIAQTILLTHDNTTLEFYQNLKKDGYQVRCIKD